MAKKFIERIVESPAVLLEETIAGSEKVKNNIENQAPLKKARQYWERLGPGLTTGAADDDPSGIATYSQTGAQYGNQLLWLSLFTFPLMAIVQEMCARVGLVTGRGLAANIRHFFPPWVLYTTTVLLFIANVFNIGADLGAMAKVSQLIWPAIGFAPLVLGFTVLSLGLQIFMSYEKYARYLKWLALILLTYVFTAFVVPNLDWSAIAHATLIPSIHLGRDQLILICAILGTTISPYLFFWQTSQEVEGMILDGKTTIAQRQLETTDEELSDMRLDVWSGMFLSNVVMFFIILTASATLHASGITAIATAADAASALRPLAGEQAYLLFALGVIGTGMLTVPVLAGSAAYAISESFGWKNGLYRKLRQASAFYGVIIIATLVGFGLNFSGIDPIKALLYSAVANGFVAPLVLILIVLISSSSKIMGNRVNHTVTTWLGWGVVVLMTIAGLVALVSFI